MSATVCSKKGATHATNLIENASEMQIVTKMLRPPPPRPCTALEAISILILTASPQSKLPTKKRLVESKRSNFLPHMSLSFAHTGLVTAVTRIYADPIQAYPAEDWKYDEITGRAVVIMVVSRATRRFASCKA